MKNKISSAGRCLRGAVCLTVLLALCTLSVVLLPVPHGARGPGWPVLSAQEPGASPRVRINSTGPHEEGTFQAGGQTGAEINDTGTLEQGQPNPASSGTGKCAVGMAFIHSNKRWNEVKDAFDGVRVRIKIQNSSCRDIPKIRVSVSSAVLSGSLQFAWSGGNTRLVDMPKAGNSSPEIVFDASFTGSGVSKFKGAIADTANVERSPKTLTTVDETPFP